MFDIKISTPKGAIFATYFKRRLIDQGEVAAVMSDKKRCITADVAHGLLGHMNDADGQKAIQYLGYELQQKPLAVCGACAEAKAKQKSLPSRVEKMVVS